ncbi:helix-turn-helix transcriptional regulator [Arthrobacter sp. StoSoilB13]|uniref:helix-turn-helix domain-containing protein n=1 Tax=Arthrobacter sp. StoSoilB13 TaxID=2830993 RepID=UPI001CC40C4B|nr:helix-turn-helix transcriptional regulator [Arthrobacter sp. StoSoilB13]
MPGSYRLLTGLHVAKATSFTDPEIHHVLLVRQTNPVYLGWHGFVPIRPQQSSEEQTLRWAERRALVGGRIREIRLEQGLSQEALALESGLSRTMIIGIEWGRKSVAYERLWDIAAVLECDITELFVPARSRPSVSPYRGGSRAMNRPEGNRALT